MNNQKQVWPFETNTPDRINFPKSIDFSEARTRVAESKRRLISQIDEDRAMLLRKAKIIGVGLVHIYDTELPREGGMTVAYRKSSPYKSGFMVDVAVATCSREDSFSRKIGAYKALEKFFAGETIQLPILRLFDATNINYAVKRAFTALNEII